MATVLTGLIRNFGAPSLAKGFNEEDHPRDAGGRWTSNEHAVDNSTFQPEDEARMYAIDARLDQHLGTIHAARKQAADAFAEHNEVLGEYGFGESESTEVDDADELRSRTDADAFIANVLSIDGTTRASNFSGPLIADSGYFYGSLRGSNATFETVSVSTSDSPRCCAPCCSSAAASPLGAAGSTPTPPRRSPARWSRSSSPPGASTCGAMPASSPPRPRCRR